MNLILDDMNKIRSKKNRILIHRLKSENAINGKDKNGKYTVKKFNLIKG